MTMIWNCTALARKTIEDLTKKIDPNHPPGLGIIQVGDDPASSLYVKIKQETALKMGMKINIQTFSKQTQTDNLLQLIDQWNDDTSIHGILVQLPLPKEMDCTAILNRINPRKDVDGLSATSQGLLWNQKPQFIPCTPKGILSLLKYHKIQLRGIRTTIVSDSRIVGRPMAACLLNEQATVTICHKHTTDLASAVQQAELLIVAVGKTDIIQSSWIHPDAIVIDIGINRLANNTVIGDVNFNELHNRVKHITPVPGGVGPMTVVSLMENTLQAFALSHTS